MMAYKNYRITYRVSGERLQAFQEALSELGYQPEHWRSDLSMMVDEAVSRVIAEAHEERAWKEKQ